MMRYFLYGEGMWESNPPRQLLITRTDFEDQKAHQHPATPMDIIILADYDPFS